MLFLKNPDGNIPVNVAIDWANKLIWSLDRNAIYSKKGKKQIAWIAQVIDISVAFMLEYRRISN